MILYIIRHAWAEEQGDSAGADDCQRPLTPEGQERFARIVKALAQRGFAPQLVATSPLLRCRQTADLVAKYVPGRPKVIERNDLAPGSDLSGILRWTGTLANDLEEVAWVGHAPDVGHLVAALIGDEESCIRFAKGAIAAIRFPGPPGIGEGELYWLVTAKVLGC
jgi:phosphohistidine phosphatase